ncbi:hypothetical protein Dda_6755 [Drechslerella dactyloides]|uniref:Uncharacterized protein n=1 Tax=Drechslerella dactyloides TaxID=74499 RepID=A0AAD6IW68_DREDA|nr:hypothetical protein Dda_6755 [Drechslerella dactyloides]
MSYYSAPSMNPYFEDSHGEPSGSIVAYPSDVDNNIDPMLPSSQGFVGGNNAPNININLGGQPAITISATSNRGNNHPILTLEEYRDSCFESYKQLIPLGGGLTQLGCGSCGRKSQNIGADESGLEFHLNELKEDEDLLLCPEQKDSWTKTSRNRKSIPGCLFGRKECLQTHLKRPLHQDLTQDQIEGSIKLNSQEDILKRAWPELQNRNRSKLAGYIGWAMPKGLSQIKILDHRT